MTNAAAKVSSLAGSVKKGMPMIHVPDIAATLEWYVALGFTELARFEDCGEVNFGLLAFGGAQFMLNVGGSSGPQKTSLWFYTNQVEALYQALKSRDDIDFVEEIYDPFYGGRQFGIRDLNGYNLFFLQPDMGQ